MCSYFHGLDGILDLSVLLKSDKLDKGSRSFFMREQPPCKNKSATSCDKCIRTAYIGQVMAMERGTDPDNDTVTRYDSPFCLAIH
jgi:hypothetical protein